jgi:hypothetical protein
VPAAGWTMAAISLFPFMTETVLKGSGDLSGSRLFPLIARFCRDERC